MPLERFAELPLGVLYGQSSFRGLLQCDELLTLEALLPVVIGPVLALARLGTVSRHAAPAAN